MTFCAICERYTDHYLLVNDERTILVRVWPEHAEVDATGELLCMLPGFAEVAIRESADHIWGPPAIVRAESVTLNQEDSPWTR